MKPLVQSGKVSDISYLIVNVEDYYIIKIDTPHEHYEFNCNNWSQAKKTLENIITFLNMDGGYEISGYL